jgi:hypothetical protein
MVGLREGPFGFFFPSFPLWAHSVGYYATVTHSVGYYATVNTPILHRNQFVECQNRMKTHAQMRHSTQKQQTSRSHRLK